MNEFQGFNKPLLSSIRLTNQAEPELVALINALLLNDGVTIFIFISLINTDIVELLSTQRF